MRVLVLALPAALVVAAIAFSRRSTITLGIAEHDAVVAIARHTRRLRLVGLLAGLLLAGALLTFGQQVDGLGRVTALAPAALGAGVLVATIVGELTAPPAVGVTRSAAVETRRVGEVLPRVRAGVLGVGSVLLLGALAVGTAWGSADDLGHAGRQFAVECTVVLEDGTTSLFGHAHGPFPGSYYALPLLGAVLVLGVLLALALRSIVRRPRPGVESIGLDTLLRRWSVAAVVEAGAVTVLGTLAPVAGFLAGGLDGGSCGLTPAQTAVRAVATVVAPLALAGAAGMLGVLLASPRIRVEDLPRPLPGDASPVGAPVR